MSYNDELQSNNEELSEILNTVNELPEAGSGGPGADGFSPIAIVTQTDDGAVVEITDKYGTTTATINHGKDGKDGSNGKDGTSVTVKSVSESTTDGGSNVVTFSDGKTVTVKNGNKGTDGKNGTDATVTAQNIKNALGYTPMNSSEYAISVKALGAKGDGATDDTAVFQSALANNRKVFVPGGTYKLSGELVIRDNCGLELAQDAVLNFTQTSGNCITMNRSAFLKGNHATVNVPYGFTGHVINVDTSVHTDTHDVVPWTHWDPQWKTARYVTDLNICKPNDFGNHASAEGNSSGIAIYMSANRRGTGSRKSSFIWGLNFSGIRIAGAFDYGIRAVNYDDGTYNNEMRIEAFMDSCKCGVSLEDCNNAYISAIVQPRKAENGAVYATHGIELIRSRNADLTGSRVWDWGPSVSLWEAGGQYQHIAMYGNCSGTILNTYVYNELYGGAKDIRELIYTDTASNFDSLIIVQEPITRWFKSVDYQPYFNNGVDGNQRLALKSEQDALFHDSQIAQFTNQLPRATDETGAVFYTQGYKQGSYWEVDGKTLLTDQYNNYIATGYIPVNGNSLIRMQGIKLTLAGNFDRIIQFDGAKEKLRHINAVVLQSGSYFATYTETEDGCEIQLTASDTARYVKLNFMVGKFTPNAVITVDEEIVYEQAGFLADGIYVNGNYVTGLDSKYMRQNQKVLEVSASSTDEQYPTAKAVYSLVTNALGSYVNEVDALIGGGS